MRNTDPDIDNNSPLELDLTLDAYEKKYNSKFIYDEHLFYVILEKKQPIYINEQINDIIEKYRSGMSLEKIMTMYRLTEEVANIFYDFIIQNNILNYTSDMVIIVPITSKCKKQLPTHYILTNDKYPFLNFTHNTVLCECIRSLSKKRLGKLIGQIQTDDLNNILKTNEYVFKIANKISKERRVYEWME